MKSPEELQQEVAAAIFIRLTSDPELIRGLANTFQNTLGVAEGKKILAKECWGLGSMFAQVGKELMCTQREKHEHNPYCPECDYTKPE